MCRSGVCALVHHANSCVMLWGLWLQVLSELAAAGIAVRIATKKLAAEEAPASYKDVSQVRHWQHADSRNRLLGTAT